MMSDYNRDWYLQEGITAAKTLMLLGQNFRFHPHFPGTGMKILRFLYEFQVFYDEYGDNYVPPKLRELVIANENALGIVNRVVFEKDCWAYVVAMVDR